METKEVEEIKRMVMELHEFFLGGYEKPGYIRKTEARLERLEAKERVRARVIWGMLVPVLAILGERVSEFFLK